ncbi:Sensor histidine kinase RcsC [Candidatus Magnetaquicoccaceae bacterium FCR-1]|uniref:histidine kinase n=1 Tax=Candidatus Magnetaquiglobus chichijimensis TaxID=3141448 RepID=A0ABQ0C4L5_9PROT
MEKILLVESSKSFAALLRQRIETELHFQVFWAATMASAKEIVRQEGNDFFLGILGLYLADAPNGEIVDYIQSLDIPSVVFTGEIKDDVRASVISKRVLDYFIKDNASSIDAVLYFIDRLRKNASIKAMVVDDSKSSRYHVGQFLKRCNFQVLEAADGPAALELLLEHPDVRLILVDYEMPGMNGFQLIKRIRPRHTRDRTAIIGLSSHGSTDMATQFLKAGANDFLTKPFRDEELLCRVSQNIEIIEKNVHFENLVAERTSRLMEAHEQLKSRERRLGSILNTALDAIITADAEGRVIGFNPAAEKLFGYSSQEALGKTVAELIIPPDQRDGHLSGMERWKATSTDRNGTLRRRIEAPAMRADGEIIDMEMALTSDVLDGDTIFTAFLHDITDRKQLLKSLEETLQVAESSNRAKSEFLANMSHEIRSPMNAIIGMTDLVLGTELTEVQRDNLLIVQNASQTLLDLINSILDLSKIEAGRFKLESIPFDVHGRIGAACETMAIRAYQKRIGFHCRISPDLPETLVGDPLRLSQVIINLIANAIKFTEKGEVVLNVQRASEETDGSVLLQFSVSDSGIGIPADRLELIFDRFTQVDGSTTRKYGGTGLGLTICRSITHLMGGNIWVESTLGEGSVFHFTARFATGRRAPSGQEAVMEARGGGGEVSLPMAGLRIVAAYDNPTGRDILNDLLDQAGAQTTMVADLEALRGVLRQAAERGAPHDLLIVDYHLLRNAESVPPELSQRDGWKNRPVVTAPPARRVEETLLADAFSDAVPFSEPALRFPLLRAVNRALGRVTASAPPRRIGGRRPITLRILVVDDMINNQKVALNLLEQAGHEVALAGNGNEALAILKTKPFDVVLMDLQMPELDGHETTRRIRAADPEQFPNTRTPIIACTAHALETDRQRCQEDGMNGFLRKPYRAEELHAALEPFLRKPATPAAEKADAPTGIAAVLKPVEGDPQEIDRQRRAFLERAPEQASRLRKALQADDFHQAQDEVEWFKSSSDRIGAYRVKWQAMRLRGQVELKNKPLSLAQLDAMEEEYRKISAILDAPANE